MKRKGLGIVLIVIGLLIVLGGFVNGNWLSLRDSNIIVVATQIIIIIAVFVIGIILIAKEKNEKSKGTQEISNNNIDDISKVISGAESRFNDLAKEKENQSLSKEDLQQIFTDYFFSNKDFYSNPNSNKFNVYFNSINLAKREMFENSNLVIAATGWDLSKLNDLFNEPNTAMRNMYICALIFLVGSYSVVKDLMYCVDFAEKVPNCIALYLLLIAQKQPQALRKQVLDTGEGSNNEELIKAMNSLKICDPFWDFSIF